MTVHQGEVYEPVNAWDRQVTEDERQYRAFLAYRDQPLETRERRSMKRIAAQLETRENTLGDWSTRFGWVSRCAAYDSMMEQRRIDARVKEVQEMERRHAQIAGAGLSAFSLPLVALGRPRLVDGNQVPRLGELEAMPTDALMRLAARTASALTHLVNVERLSRGEATQILAVPPVEVARQMATEEHVAGVFAAIEEAGLGTWQPS